MQPTNNLYNDPYSQCPSYWKTTAASSSSDLTKTNNNNNNHSNRLGYSLDHPHSSNMHYMSSSVSGLSSQLDIKSEHSSPIKNSQLTLSGGDDSNESHPTGTEDDNDEDDEDMDLKTPEKDESNHTPTNAPRKSNRRAEKPPCKNFYSSFFLF